MELKNVEKLEKSQVKLTIVVSGQELENAKEKAYHKNVGKIAVPGFRKGKAPRKIIEKLYGDGVFFEDAVNICYPDAYEKAIEEAKIVPVGRADVDITEADGEGFTFVATVPVEPEVEIGEYKGLTAEKEEPKVEEEDIKQELDRLAKRTARTENVEREAKAGDTAVIDFEGFIDGVPFDGGKGENYSLVLGSGNFIPGFEDQIAGHKAGEDVEVALNFPEDYHAEELKGKPAVFKCKIHEVQETILPEMDDEFAKDVSDFDTLDELKKDIENKILENRRQAADHDYEEKLLDGVLEGLKADIPEAMFESQLDNIVNDFGYRVQMQGIGLEQYIAMNGMDMTSFRKLFRDQAERQVKVRLALQKIAEKENFEISDDDIEEEYNRLSKEYGMEAAKVKTMVPVDSIRGDMKLTRALELIKESAKIKKKRAPRKKKAEAESAE